MNSTEGFRGIPGMRRTTTVERRARSAVFEAADAAPIDHFFDAKGFDASDEAVARPAGLVALLLRRASAPHDNRLAVEFSISIKRPTRHAWPLYKK